MSVWSMPKLSMRIQKLDDWQVRHEKVEKSNKVPIFSIALLAMIALSDVQSSVHNLFTTLLCPLKPER